MDKNSDDYKRFKAEYEADKKQRRDNPEKYPYFAYFQYGFHNMTYLTEKEVHDAVRFYRLFSDGKGGYERFGKQPIFIIPRKDRENAEIH